DIFGMLRMKIEMKKRLKKLKRMEIDHRNILTGKRISKSKIRHQKVKESNMSGNCPDMIK
ncbi:13059_t:CDS:2, partial [Acaulospora morrowiae]